MAVYKIPQDVEADDKFVGPLSFKQFIFCGIAFIAGYLSFLSLTKGFWPALIFFFPVIIVFGFLGFPWGRDQPTEIWLAARIRFFIKPRVRIWNQAGIKELVTITAPKHIEKSYTKNLSQTEVKSRLTGLADLLDSRGWAVRNVSADAYSNRIAVGANDASDDRLFDITTVPQEVNDAASATDVLDEVNSPTAQHFTEMIKASEEKHRQDIMQQISASRDATPAQVTKAPQNAQADFWFLQQNNGNGPADAGASSAAKAALDAYEADAALKTAPPSFATFQTPAVVAPHSASVTPIDQEANLAAKLSTADEQALLQKIHKSEANPVSSYSHLKTVMPLEEQTQPTVPAIPEPLAYNSAIPDPHITVPAQAPPQMAPTVTPPMDPAIMNLASNSDLNVATIARQANKKDEGLSDNEVVISLR